LISQQNSSEKKMEQVCCLNQRLVDNIGRILRLISILKATSKRFLRTRHNRRTCNCLDLIPSKELLEEIEVQVKALRDLVILGIHLQTFAPLPTLSELICQKVRQHFEDIQFLRNAFLLRKDFHDPKLTSLI